MIIVAMKVYILVDTEGEACVVGHGPGGAKTGPWQFEYVRRRATAEATAAVEGAREGGATDIVVHDAGFLRGHSTAAVASAVARRTRRDHPQGTRDPV